MRLTVGGQNIVDKNVVRQPEWSISGSGDYARFKTELIGVISDQRLKLTLTGELWFDGLFTLRLATDYWPVKWRNQLIKYRIPLNKDVGRFLHRYGELGKRNVDLDTVNNEMLSAYTPFMWIGNDSRGLFWFSESSVGWKNARDSNALRLLHEQDHWVLEVSVRPRILH